MSEHIFFCKTVKLLTSDSFSHLKNLLTLFPQVEMALRVLGDRCRAVADVTAARCLQGVELLAAVEQVTDAQLESSRTLSTFVPDSARTA